MFALALLYKVYNFIICMFLHSKLCLYLFIKVLHQIGFVINGLYPTILSTLERQFELNSEDVAFISTSYDYSAGTLIIPILIDHNSLALCYSKKSYIL